ncbi:hypothetical protein LCGC14_0422190 [marine sediment metagenome]|uniref:Alpha/beta hydrolase n=1 Tax=marine sediment metagenome TaxID=412755 RepID=A0A0F9SWQ9_9ZZZZ
MHKAFNKLDKDIERIALKLNTEALTMPSVLTITNSTITNKLAILLHGTDTVPNDFFNRATYLNNLGNRLTAYDYVVSAPYIVREAKTLQRIRSLSERIKCTSFERDLALGIASSIPFYFDVVIYGISWGAEVAISLARIMKPRLLILSGLDPDPVDTLQHKFSLGKKLDPMYVPARPSLYATLQELETTTILEYGNQDIDPSGLDSLGPWPDNVLELRFQGGHEINPTDTTLKAMERLLEQTN